MPTVPHRELHIDDRPAASAAGSGAGPGKIWPPSWPMGLTMLRLLLLPVFLWLLLLDAGPEAPGRVNPHRWWALGVFAVMALTDKLDGYLARRLNQTTRLGMLLDPIADKLLVASSLILLGSKWVAAPGFAIPIYVVAAVYLKDVVVAGGSIYILYTIGSVAIKPRPLGKIGTFLQLALVIGVIAAPDLAALAPGATRRTLGGLEALVAAVAIASVTDYTLLAVRQSLAFRRRRASGGEPRTFPGQESLN
jgi:CDP-diacylglycerol--glycerol-3-phosphate 3-phosphatidyltransferase